MAQIPSNTRWLVASAMVASLIALAATPGQVARSSQIPTAMGEAVFAQNCARCHGDMGAGADAPPLVGPGRLTFFRTALRLADFISVAMPADDPGSISRDEVFAVVAWLMEQNGYLPAGLTLDDATAAELFIE